jgi:hyperosmotically inducible protein
MQRRWLAFVMLGCGYGAYAAISTPQSFVVQEIHYHLQHANVLKHGDVQVTFANGVATLSGTVDSLGVKMDAQNMASRDEDVIRVVNDIRVSSTGVSSEQILVQARRRLLTCYAYTIFDHVDIAVHENILVVRGEVTQPYKKDAIAYGLAHTRGIAALENDITVLPLSTYDEDLRTRVARAIYDDPSFEGYVDAGRLPIHIIVNQGNVTLAGAVDSEADRARAEQDARLVTSASDVPVTNNLQIGGGD